MDNASIRARLTTSLAALAVATATYASANSPGVLPANLSVEVISVRAGDVSNRIVAKVRPGERVLIRDEKTVPYVIASGPRGQRMATVSTGVVSTVIPVVEGRDLVFRMETTVTEIDGFEEGDYSPDGKETFKVKWPRVTTRNLEARVVAAAAEGRWKGAHEIPGGTYRVDVVAKPLSAP